MKCLALLLINLTWVVYPIKVTSRAQGSSMTISLTMPKTTNMSSANLKWFCLKDTEKLLFHMKNGVVTQSLISDQFKGRVLYKYNISENIFYLELLNFTEDDAGSYLLNFYDGVGNSGSEHFALGQPHTNDVTTPTSGLEATGGGTKQPPGDRARIGLVVAGVVVLLLGALIWKNWKWA